jgi:hypothetical protein
MLVPLTDALWRDRLLLEVRDDLLCPFDGQLATMNMTPSVSSLPTF